MAYTILNNLNKEADNNYQFYVEPPATNTGFGSQFILYTAVVLSKVKVRFFKFNSTSAPTGNFVAQIYHSHSDIFMDRNDYADGLIAQSTNTLDIENLDADATAEVEFTFDDVPLPTGIYFICVFSSDFASNDGYVYLIGTDKSVSTVGCLTFWYDSENKWGTENEW